jgi:hypothetical protein
MEPGAALAGFLRGRRALLCYGLMGDAVVRLGLDYMDAHADWLAAHGAQPEVLRVPTADPVAANAERLRAALQEGPPGALVIGHSKGGVEALAALIEPATAARCATFLAFQSPFYGSEVADLVTDSRRLTGIALATARLFRSGSGRGLADLTTAARRAWMAAHAEEVRRLVESLPVVTVASHFRPRLRIGRGPHLAALALWLRDRVGPNDGQVAVNSALLPGARHLIEQGSHIALVARGPGQDPQGALRRALLAALA